LIDCEPRVLIEQITRGRERELKSRES